MMVRSSHGLSGPGVNLLEKPILEAGADWLRRALSGRLEPVGRLVRLFIQFLVEESLLGQHHSNVTEESLGGLHGVGRSEHADQIPH